MASCTIEELGGRPTGGIPEPDEGPTSCCSKSEVYKQNKSTKDYLKSTFEANAPCIRDSALWLVYKTHATLSANQMQD